LRQATEFFAVDVVFFLDVMSAFKKAAFVKRVGHKAAWLRKKKLEVTVHSAIMHRSSLRRRCIREAVQKSHSTLDVGPIEKLALNMQLSDDH